MSVQYIYTNLYLKISFPAQISNRARDIQYLTLFALIGAKGIHKMCILLGKNCKQFRTNYSVK